jgi:lipoic acid synthetase
VTLIQIEEPRPAPAGRQPKPPWLKVRLPQGEAYFELKRLVREQSLHTVCESASCPNIGECWARRSLTIMILGGVCTRSCGFCDVPTGRPLDLDLEEPARVAEALSRLTLRHAVLTSVNRDELPDGGAAVWAATIRAVRARCPSTRIEVLIPDFKGSASALRTVLDAGPDILAHNLETVPRLYRRVRPQADYAQSLELLERAKASGFATKSSLMLGLGETLPEVRSVLRDLRAVRCDGLTLGQYLRPSPRHLPVERFVPPGEFLALRAYALDLGFTHVASGPLVRSSYHADEQAEGKLVGGL